MHITSEMRVASSFLKKILLPQKLNLYFIFKLNTYLKCKTKHKQGKCFLQIF